MARRRSGKKIDYVHWTYGSFQTGGLSAGTLAKNFFAAQHDPETLLRFRGSLLGYLDGVQSPGAWISVGVGLILVPEGTGTTVLWSPITDGDAPWIWVDYFELAYEEYVVDVISAQGASSYRSIIDNKAMRIARNQEVQCVVENATIGNTADLNLSMSGRFLAGR